MKIKLFTFVLLAMLIFSCGRVQKEYNVVYDQVSSPELAYNETSLAETRFRGTGYNPEGPSRTETPPAFRDMSNLYGQINDGASSESANLNNPERKLVKRANVRIRVENLQEADAYLTSLMKEYNAYAASTTIEENLHVYSLRVPALYYDVFLDGTNGMGRLLHRSETTEDVTLRYYDLEGQLASKRELLKTFQSYLGRANNIEEILAVEARISQVQYDIERTGTQLRTLANTVDYATIDLRLLGPVAAIPTQAVSFGERIKQLFGGFGSFLSSIAVILLGIIIYGIPSLLLLGLLFWLFFGKIGLARKLWGVIRK